MKRFSFSLMSTFEHLFDESGKRKKGLFGSGQGWEHLVSSHPIVAIFVDSSS